MKTFKMVRDSAGELLCYKFDGGFIEKGWKLGKWGFTSDGYCVCEPELGEVLLRTRTLKEAKEFAETL